MVLNAEAIMKQGHSSATQVGHGHCQRANSHFALHPLALALACLVMPEWALALPEGFNPVSGLVNQNLATPGVMNLQQGSDRAIVNWNSFNIGATESVNISQPNATSAMLNRVTGGVTSSIAGSLTANGRVFLVNPSGVVFGAGSRVSTGGLVASTLDISDDDFNNGRWNFSRAVNNNAAIINSGDLQAGPQGTIALLGAVVRNEGNITADGGTAALVSARQVTLDFQGDGLTNFIIPGNNLDALALVENTATGVVQANGGRVKIFADSNAIAPLVVNQKGVLRARSLEQHGGEIVLAVATKTDNDPDPLGGNRVEIGGELNASGIGAAAGGHINIAGGGLYFNDTAVLDVSGASGGGIIDVKGKESVMLAKGSSLIASALIDGNGGALNLQGGRSLTAHGSLQARGIGSGTGGTIVTSARAVNLAGVQVDAAGTTGTTGNTAGTWSIDPVNIRVSHDSGDGCCALENPFDLVTEVNSVVLDSAINASLDSGSNVRIHTTPVNPTDTGSNIIFEQGVFVHRKQGGNPLELRFEADDSIAGSNFFIKSDLAPLGVVFNANANESRSGGGGVSLIFDNINVFDSDIDDDNIPDNRSVISTGGGGVSIFGGKDDSVTTVASGLDPVINLSLLDIDTRDAASVRNASVFMRGHSTSETAALLLVGTTINTGIGNITLKGISSTDGVGVELVNNSISAEKGGVTIDGEGGGILVAGGLIQSLEGDVSLTGSSPQFSGLSITDGAIRAGSGDVLVKGETLNGFKGLDIGGISNIRTESGNIVLTGLAGQNDGAVTPRKGLLLHGFANITTDSGNIDLLGRVAAADDGDSIDPSFESAGLFFNLDGGEITISSLTGNVSLSGEAANGSNSLGLRVITSSSEATGKVSAGNRLDIRATSNEPTKLAFDLGDLSLTGTVQTILRPGGVDVDGKLTESNTTAIQLGDGPDGSTPISNFIVNQATVDQITTPRLVIGSELQSASIVGVDSLTLVSDRQLTLQAEGSGGSIDLRAPLTVPNGTLSLLADGQISQSDTGTLTSGQLLAISHNGSVLLSNPANAPDVIAGEAAGDFSFINVDTLSIGTVEGTSGIKAGTVSIRTLDGDLSVDQAVIASAGSGLFDSAGTLDVNAPVSVVSGTLSLSANGQINQNANGALIAEQLLAISRNGSVLLNNPANAAHVLAGSAAEDFAFTGTGNLSVGNVGRRSGLEAGTVALRNLAGDMSLDQAVTATADTATFDSAGSLTVAAPLSVANGNLTLSADGQISQSDSGTLTSEQLLAISRNGSVLLNNPANAPHVIAGRAAGDFSFTNVDDLSIGTVEGTSGVQAGTVSINTLEGTLSVDQTVIATAGSAALESAGTLDVNAPVSVANGTLALSANGQISQSGTGTLTSEQLLAISRNAGVLLNNPANAAHVLAGSAAQNFAFTGTGNLSVGSVGDTSGLQAGTVTMSNLAGDMSLDQAVTATAGTATFDSAGLLTVAAPLSAANGTLTLTADGQISQGDSGALTSEQLLAISRNAGVLLNNPANAAHVIAGSAAQNFAFSGAGNLSVGSVAGSSRVQAGTVALRNLAGDMSLDQAVTATAGTATFDSAGSLTVAAPLSVPNGTLTLTADGQISQGDSGTLTSEQLLAISRNGSVLLNNPANAAHVVAGSAAQDFTFTGASNLSVGTVAGTSGVQAGTVAVRNLAGDISVDQAVTATAGRAALDSAGALAVNAPVSVPNGTLALTANGQISQGTSGALTSEQLLAVSRNASVLLNNPANAPHVVAGRAAGEFAFTNADNLSVGTVDGVSGVQAASVFIRNLDGDLTLDQSVVATAGSAVLVTGGRLQNPAGQTISASTFWQIWANTWIGENRGGLLGSGRLANLYGCAFGGNCASAAGLATTAGDNHFLYLQQPTAQVTIASGSGPFGVVPQFRTSISGLVLGDSGSGISGSPDSAFSQIARPGTFSVGGTFTSAEGYLLTVVPGTWTNYLFGAVDARPDWTRERPDTWLYDHNMGGSPMCAAPGVTVASAVQQGDVLAREWSLVKSRPKLSSCVASDKQNGCSDF
jgi:filamentous hemagglutinin family protein